MSLQEELFLVRLVGGGGSGSGQLFPTANLHPPAQAHCSALTHSGGIFSVFHPGIPCGWGHVMVRRTDRSIERERQRTYQSHSST